MTIGYIEKLLKLMEKYTVTSISIDGVIIERPPLLPKQPQTKPAANDFIPDELGMLSPEQLEDSLYSLGKSLDDENY